LLEKIPYQLIVGERDAAAGTVAVRTKSAEQGSMLLAEFINRCEQEIDTKGQAPATTKPPV
jgi:threonyl-tRNA synthetase